MTITKQSDRSFQVQLRDRTEDFTLLGRQLVSVNSQPTICGAINLDYITVHLVSSLRNGESITLGRE